MVGRLAPVPLIYILWTLDIYFILVKSLSFCWKKGKERHTKEGINILSSLDPDSIRSEDIEDCIFAICFSSVCGKEYIENGVYFCLKRKET